MKNLNNTVRIDSKVNGMAKMAQQGTVERYIDNLIRENKKTTPDGYSLFVEDLHPADQEEFLSYLIEADYLDRDSFEWLFYSPAKHELSSLFGQFLKSYGSSRDDLKEKFLYQFKKEAINVNIPRMQSLIDYRMGWVEWSDSEERHYPEEHAFL